MFRILPFFHLFSLVKSNLHNWGLEEGKVVLQIHKTTLIISFAVDRLYSNRIHLILSSYLIKLGKIIIKKDTG